MIKPSFITQELLMIFLDSSKKLLAVFLTLTMVFIATFSMGASSEILAAPEPDPIICPTNRTPSQFEHDLRKALLGEPSVNSNILTFSSAKHKGSQQYELLQYEGCPEEMGAWLLLPMPDNESDRMQAVHSILLPNGKVLIVNGSSNRNRFEKLEGRQPEDGVDSYKGEIIFENAVYIFKEGVDTRNSEVVDNTSIFDPQLADPIALQEKGEKFGDRSPFERISSPVAESGGEPNDIFCSGHLQLPNGNVLFVGGSRVYYIGPVFQGSKQANIYDWQSQTWSEPHLLEDGHWYPTLVPLKDGAIATFSGLGAKDFERVSPIVEIYDPNATTEEKKWQHIDISQLPNSPFKKRMNSQTFIKDSIDLYPRIFPTKDGRFLITGDGGGKTPLRIHKSTNSYFVTFEKDNDGTYSITFQPGPKREAVSKVYGTASLDPNSKNGDVLLYGGIIGSNDISFGPGKYAIRGASIVASVERWIAPEPSKTESKALGEWVIDEDFLARIDEDILQNSSDDYKNPQYEYVKQSSNLGRFGKRAMESAVILPTKQVLVVNGGNYPYHLPVYHPTLLTPNDQKDPTRPEEHLGFDTKLMNPDIQPRLYHSTALLLPDASVLVMGGNNSMAGRFVDSGKVELDISDDFFLTPKGFVSNTAEIYQHSIYYPPYLFGQSKRPVIDTNITEIHYGESKDISVSNASGSGSNDSIVLIKAGSVTHSFDMGQRLVDLDKNYVDSEKIKFTVPVDKHFSPPGYYMLFYVNADGKPSKAKIVKLS